MEKYERKCNVLLIPILLLSRVDNNVEWLFNALIMNKSPKQQSHKRLLTPKTAAFCCFVGYTALL